MKDHIKLLTSMLLAHLITIIGLYFYWDSTWLWASLLGIILFGALGIEGYCHRLLSHKSFTVSDNIDKFLNVCALFGLQGPPMIWAANHVTHHQYSDVDGDPHPATDGWRTWFWIGTETNSQINLSVIKRLSRNKMHRFIKDYYYAIYWSTLAISFIINPKIAIYFFAIPAVYTLHASSWVNVFSHSFGYRNHETNDNSRNIHLPFLLLHPYHNNHHANAGNYDISEKWYEFDYIKYLIDILKDK